MESIEQFLKPFELSDEKLSDLAVEFTSTFKHLAWHSEEQFLATPINVLPTGLETGQFLAIDVGGSNLRVAFIELLGDRQENGTKICTKYLKRWPIEDRVKNDQATDLFLWIGDCIAEVVRDCLDNLDADDATSLISKGELPMGITFSFPMIQKSISEATLMAMGKGFAITSDLDLGGLLVEGYAQHVDPSRTPRLPKLKIVAIANDSVATLATLAYNTGTRTSSSRTSVGLIMGTGANAALALPRAHLPSSKVDPLILPASAGEHPMVITNTEFTLRGIAQALKAHNLQTKWDLQLDSEVETPGFQPFEYMTSGRYIGELVRLTFNSYLCDVQNVDLNALPEPFRHRNGFLTKFLSDTASFESPEEWKIALCSSFPVVNGDSRKGHLWSWTDDNAGVLMRIAKAVQVRSSRLLASAVVGLLACADELQLDRQADLNGNEAHELRELVVAYAGGVIESYPQYKQTCQDALDQLVATIHSPKGSVKVSLREAKDSGVVGAGILAGTVWNLDERG